VLRSKDLVLSLKKKKKRKQAEESVQFRVKQKIAERGIAQTNRLCPDSTNGALQQAVWLSSLSLALLAVSVVLLVE
jgi:hypothetical protein